MLAHDGYLNRSGPPTPQAAPTMVSMPLRRKRTDKQQAAPAPAGATPAALPPQQPTAAVETALAGAAPALVWHQRLLLPVHDLDRRAFGWTAQRHSRLL